MQNYGQKKWCGTPWIAGSPKKNTWILPGINIRKHNMRI